VSLSAGKLRHRIAIQEFVSIQDSNGDMTEAWETVAGMSSVPAAIEPLSAREFIQSATEQMQSMARITIRYRALPAKFRILHKSKIYNPAGVLADKDSGLEYLTLPCSEGVNNG
jgi:SPP1 family predicted phage head-tail adaptor